METHRMIYVRRFLVVLFFIPRVLLAFCAMIVLFNFDMAAIPVYYIKTGRCYVDDFNPLGIEVAKWLFGFGFQWKDRI